MTSIQKARKLVDKKFDALLVSSIPNIIFLTGFEGFSTQEREAYLLLTKRKNYIFTDGRYSEAAGKIKNFELIEISSEKKFEDRLKEIVTKEKIKKLAVDENDIKVSEVLKIKKAVGICSDENLIEDLRKVKDGKEIGNIQKACKLGDQVFKYILSKIKSGVTEKEIAHAIEVFILGHGAQIAFKPIVAYGANSSSPHHVSSKRKLKRNEIVLLDFGVKTEGGYCSDMTRTFFAGRASKEQKKVYKTVLEAQTKAIEFIKSSILNHQSIDGSKVDMIAREYIEGEDYSTIPHSLGHGIGLEVHEKPCLSPKSRDLLINGMVFSVEPGIYIPGFGGIRIEDLVLLTEKGPQIITRANREIIEL
jgi:Xaa-Pro aminopeptidase